MVDEGFNIHAVLLFIYKKLLRMKLCFSLKILLKTKLNNVTIFQKNLSN